MRILAVPWDISSFSNERDDIASLTYSRGEVQLRIDRASFREHRGRARFSIAHEIGHLILFRALGSEVFDLAERDDSTYREVEALCDLAASHLLLPRAPLAAALRARGFTRAGVQGLRETFDVSETAVLRATADLLPEGSILDWRRFRRSDEEASTWRVWRTLGPTELEEKRPWLPRGCTLKHLHLPPPSEWEKSDTPHGLRGVQVALGRKRSTHDGMLTHWTDLGGTPRPLLDSEEQGPKMEFGNERMLVALGRAGYSDLAMFLGPS